MLKSLDQIRVISKGRVVDANTLMVITIATRYMTIVKDHLVARFILKQEEISVVKVNL